MQLISGVISLNYLLWLLDTAHRIKWRWAQGHIGQSNTGPVAHSDSHFADADVADVGRLLHRHRQNIFNQRYKKSNRNYKINYTL